jgi:hypothetical protein
MIDPDAAITDIALILKGPAIGVSLDEDLYTRIKEALHRGLVATMNHLNGPDIAVKEETAVGVPRFTIGEEQFAALVAGEDIELRCGETRAKAILSDIGFGVMIKWISDAMAPEDRQIFLENHHAATQRDEAMNEACNAMDALARIYLMVAEEPVPDSPADIVLAVQDALNERKIDEVNDDERAIFDQITLAASADALKLSTKLSAMLAIIQAGARLRNGLPAIASND